MKPKLRSLIRAVTYLNLYYNMKKGKHTFLTVMTSVLCDSQRLIKTRILTFSVVVTDFITFHQIS